MTVPSKSMVKKILVDGKEFMTGDTKTALKNLPTSIIDKIKAYDEKSDLSKVTGIDDGEEQTVLDFNVKKGMNKGLMSNIDLGIGNKNRYSARGMGGYFNSNNRFMLFGNANNTSDRGFGGGGPRRGFGGGNGLNASKMLAANYNYEEKNKFKFNTSLRWNHSDGDVWSRRSSENFLGSSSSFSNSLNQSFSRSDSWNGNIRLEWMPDTMTNILFRPSISWTTNDSRSTGLSASFNQDPYQYSDDPLSDEGIEKMDEVDAVINRQKSVSLSNSKNNNIRGMLQLNRKLNNKGRNVTLRMDAKYTDKDSKSISLQNAHLYLVQNEAGLDSTYQTNQNPRITVTVLRPPIANRSGRPPSSSSAISSPTATPRVTAAPTISVNIVLMESIQNTERGAIILAVWMANWVTIEMTN